MGVHMYQGGASVLRRSDNTTATSCTVIKLMTYAYWIVLITCEDVYPVCNLVLCSNLNPRVGCLPECSMTMEQLISPLERSARDRHTALGFYAATYHRGPLQEGEVLLTTRMKPVGDCVSYAFAGQYCTPMLAKAYQDRQDDVSLEGSTKVIQVLDLTDAQTVSSIPCGSLKLSELCTF